MKIDVISGGPGRESSVSRISGEAVCAALRSRGHDVLELRIEAELDPARLRPGAIAFDIVHGTYGEDGTLQALLEARQVPFVGSDAAVSRLCMDKAATKQRLTTKGIRVPWGVEIHLGTPFKPTDFKLPHFGPLVMKPANEGSSVGLRMVANPSFLLPAAEELLRDVGPKPYLIEERLPGPEYTVAVIDEDGGPRALPPIAIQAKGVFDFHAKYHATDTVEEPIPDGPIARRLGALAVAAHLACGCRDVSRTDIMRTADDDYAVLEINTLPGMTGASLLPKAAAAAGIPFPVLVERFCERAARRGVLV
jgi:D-alanine-D-alanine ligase